MNVACVLLEYVGRQGQVGAGRERWVWGVAPIGESFLGMFIYVCGEGNEVRMLG